MLVCVWISFWYILCQNFHAAKYKKFSVKRLPDTGEIKFSDKIKLGDEIQVIIPEKQQKQLPAVNKKINLNWMFCSKTMMLLW